MSRNKHSDIEEYHFKNIISDRSMGTLLIVEKPQTTTTKIEL